MRKFKFRGIVFEDVVLKEADGLNDWSQVCQGCVEAHRLATGEDMRLNEYPMEGDICGIDGCDTPADFYIDFAENALVNMKVVVGRHINGIGLNSLEYLLDDDGTIGKLGQICTDFEVKHRNSASIIGIGHISPGKTALEGDWFDRRLVIRAVGASARAPSSRRKNRRKV